MLKRAWIWIKRCIHSRGFGVQSPNDYRFVRYVINEHYPYYAYKDMEERYPGEGWKFHKLGQLYLRLVNFVQPQSILNLNSTPLYDDYVRKGSGKANFTSVLTDAVDLIFLNPSIVDSLLQRSLLDNLHNGMMVVVEGIFEDKASRHFWQLLKEDSKVTITYDLYYAGIAVLDNKRYKQHYIINF